MGIGAHRGGRRSGFDSRRHCSPLAEINVTPLVDVILVLLIIFMVTAPMLIVGVDVQLPSGHARALESTAEPVVITIDHEGKVFLQDGMIGPEVLAERLKAMVREADERIYIRADDGVEYGRVVEVMASLQDAGLENFSLVMRKRD